MKVSVISATYNRAEALDNALYTYSKQTLPFDEWEYLIADDASQDNTKGVVKSWQKKGLPVRYFHSIKDLGLYKKEGEWRDGCIVRNSVSTYANGLVLVATHPEIMIPPNALEIMYEYASGNPDSWITAIPYWLPEGKMTAWKKDLHNLATMEGFYDPDWPHEDHSPGAIDYANNNQEVRTTWESEVFWAMSMAKWRWLGGFREFKVWGSVDMDFLDRRRIAGIPTVIASDPDSPAPSGNLMVYHQWHGESPRDMDAAMEALRAGRDYSTVDKMRACGGLYNVYNHGPRERAPRGVEGILDDHVERYRWASFYCKDKAVLDIGCGTGYGASIITDARWYLGIDIDAESVEYAKKLYPGDFAVMDATDMKGIETGSIDQVLSFEVFEHIEDKAAYLAELRRVLKDGGNFIISTPQYGAARGTPWDRWMVSQEELADWFSGEGFKGLDWFFQRSYGKSPVERGVPPKNAEIMILGGTVVKDG